MPQKKYSLVLGEQPRLHMSWKGVWKNISIKLDNKEIGIIPNFKELKKGRQYNLEDGSTLEVRFDQGFMNSALVILYNGNPVPGSGTDPIQTLKVASGILYFIAAINVLLGILGEITQAEPLVMLGADIFMVGIGLVFGLFGYYVKRKSSIAVSLAIALIISDIVMSLMTVTANGRPNTHGLFIKILFIIFIAKSYSAIKELKSRDSLYDKVNVFN